MLHNEAALAFKFACMYRGMGMGMYNGSRTLQWWAEHAAVVQGVVTYAPPVEAFATGIKIGSNDQRYFSDRSSDHSHFHERSRIKKARRDVTIRQRTRTYAPRGAYRDLYLPGYRY